MASRFGAKIVNAPRPSRFGAKLVSPPVVEPQTLRQFVGEQTAQALTPETAIAGGYVDDFVSFLREKADKLDPESDDRKKIDETISGLRRNVADYRTEQHEANRLGVDRATANRLNSPVGAFEQSLAQTAVGQTALRAEQGLSNIAEAGLSMASRTLGSGQMSATLHRDKARRDEFLQAAERGGQVENILGQTGSRIYNSVVNSVAKFGAVSALAGPSAVYSLIAGESYDDALHEADEHGMTGAKRQVYAVAKGAVETGLTILMGKAGKRLGISSFEESLSPGMRRAAQQLAWQAVGKNGLSKLAGEAAGIGMESAEELLIDAVQQGVELTAGTSKGFDWQRLFESGVAGAVARGATSVSTLKDSLRKIPSQNIEETVKGVAAAEELAGVSPISRTAGELGDKVTRRFFENATPEMLAAARQPMSQKEFAAVTGLKKTSKVFRKAFVDTLDLYAQTSNPTNSSQNETPTSPAVASEAPGVTSDPSAVGATQTAAGETMTTETAADPAATSASRAMVDRDRELWDLPEIPTPESQSLQVWLDTARTNGVPGRALVLAVSVIAEPRAFSPVETAGVVIRAADLKGTHERLLGELQSITDSADVAVRSAELNRIEAEFETLTRALRTSGTEKGRALAAQKLTINQNYDLLTVLTRAKASKGAELTADQRTELEQLTAKAKQAQQQLESFETRQTNREKEQTHREVARLRSAVTAIRRQLGLDATADTSTDVPALSDSDKKTLAGLGEKLKAAEAALGREVDEQIKGAVNNRPSEREVSNLDDAVARARAAMKRTARDSAADEKRRIEVLEKRLGEAQETLSKVRDGETPQQRQRRADVMSQQRDKLHYDLMRTRQEIKDAIVKAKPKNVWNHAQSFNDISRGLITSIDYSAVGRQAKFAVWAHPFIAAKNIPAMFKAGWDDRHAYKIEQEILSRPNAPLYELGMTIHRRDASLSDREEALATKLLERPIKVNIGGQERQLWNPVAGSARAYVTFINRMRADVFDSLAKIHGGDMGLTHQQYKELGHLINVNTGRGGFGAADKHMRSASVVLFAPRFLLSRMQYSLGEPAWRSSNEVRKIVAAEYARSFLGAAVWYGLYELAWGDDPRFSITFDWRSPDFGKIVLGDTRLDPLGGLAQVTRFAGRMLTGQTIKNGRVTEMSPTDKWNEVSRFARSKASPTLGQALNYMTGADVMGNPVNLSSAEGAANLVAGLVLPLSLRDIGDAMVDQGVSRGTALAILNMFGEGIQVYEPRERARR